MAESITAFFSRLGFPLNNHRTSWGATGPDGALLLRTWQDGVSEKGRRVAVFDLPSGDGNWDLSPGLSERLGHLERIWGGGVAAYTVIARAHDIQARPRAIAGFRGDLVFPIERLEQGQDGSIVAVLSSPPIPTDRLKVDAETRRAAANTAPFPSFGVNIPRISKPPSSGSAGTSFYLNKLPGVRDRLIVVARSQGKIRYGELMIEFNVGRFNLRRLMSRLGRQCQESGEPILTSLIVNKATGRCSNGLVSEFDIVDDDAERARCYAYWIEESGFDAETAALVERARSFAEVEMRPDQAEFRRKVFIACNGGCVVSGCSVSAALDAAHIKNRDWRAGHNNAEDGMLLRADIHRLYDAGLLRISSGGVVELMPEITDAYAIYGGIEINLPHLTFGSGPTS